MFVTKPCYNEKTTPSSNIITLDEKLNNVLDTLIHDHSIIPSSDINTKQFRNTKSINKHCTKPVVNNNSLVIPPENNNLDNSYVDGVLNDNDTLLRSDSRGSTKVNITSSANHNNVIDSSYNSNVDNSTIIVGSYKSVTTVDPSGRKKKVSNCIAPLDYSLHNIFNINNKNAATNNDIIRLVPVASKFSGVHTNTDKTRKGDKDDSFELESNLGNYVSDLVLPNFSDDLSCSRS